MAGFVAKRKTDFGVRCLVTAFTDSYTTCESGDEAPDVETLRAFASLPMLPVMPTIFYSERMRCIV